MSTEARRREPDDHVDAALQYPVEPGESSVEGAVLDATGPPPGAGWQALDRVNHGPAVGSTPRIEAQSHPTQLVPPRHISSRSFQSRVCLLRAGVTQPTSANE